MESSNTIYRNIPVLDQNRQKYRALPENLYLLRLMSRAKLAKYLSERKVFQTKFYISTYFTINTFFHMSLVQLNNSDAMHTVSNLNIQQKDKR
jgi:hypothetical protein